MGDLAHHKYSTKSRERKRLYVQQRQVPCPIDDCFQRARVYWKGQVLPILRRQKRRNKGFELTTRERKYRRKLYVWNRILLQVGRIRFYFFQIINNFFLIWSLWELQHGRKLHSLQNQKSRLLTLSCPDIEAYLIADWSKKNGLQLNGEVWSCSFLRNKFQEGQASDDDGHVEILKLFEQVILKHFSYCKHQNFIWTKF